MTVALKEARETRRESRADTRRREREPEPSYSLNGAALVAAARGAVAAVARPYKISEHERDALVSETVLRVIAAGKGERGQAGRAYMQQVARGLLRDDRSWRDVAGEQRRRDRQKSRPAAPGLALTVAEQAERYREHDQEREQAREVSLDSLTERAEQGEAPRDLLRLALERDDRARGTLPPPLAAHSGEVAALLVEWLTDAGRIGPGDHRPVLVALLQAQGERLATIARERGCSLVTAKRDSAKGARLLRESVTAGELAQLRYRAALALNMREPESEPVRAALAWAARRAVESAQGTERDRLAAYMAGGSEPVGPSLVAALRRNWRGYTRPAPMPPTYPDHGPGSIAQEPPAHDGPGVPPAYPAGLHPSPGWAHPDDLAAGQPRYTPQRLALLRERCPTR